MTKFDDQVLIVGMGVAGFSAALSAKEKGHPVTVVHAGASASALQNGGWDVCTDLLASRQDVLFSPRTLKERLEAWIKNHPFHPYSLCGESSSEIFDANKAVLDVLDYATLNEDSHGSLFVTETGLLRRGSTGQTQALNLDNAPTGKIAVLDMPGVGTYDAHFIAKSLRSFFTAYEKGVLRWTAEVLTLESPLLLSNYVSSRMAQMILDAVKEAQCSTLLLPSLKGWCWEVLRSSTVACGEVLSGNASGQGLRLDRQMRQVLEDKKIEVQHKPVQEVRTEGGVAVVDFEDGTTVHPKSVVLAAGKYVGGGIEDVRGVPRCSLGSFPLVHEGKALALPTSPYGYDPDVFYGRSMVEGGPGYAVGLKVDSSFRVLGQDNAPVANNLFACGSILSDVDPARDGTASGMAAWTGTCVGKNL